MAFLNDIAAELIGRFGTDFSRVTVVLPSKRGGLFLRKHIASRLNKPFIPPAVTTPTELFSQWCELTPADPSELLFILFEVYTEQLGNKADGFDRFLRWGQMLLNDFNDIDRYQIDTKSLFRDLRNIKAQELEIESWSFEGEDLSENQERYLEFWNAMPGLYAAYRKRLSQAGMAYGGQLYRDVAEHLSERLEEGDHQWWFAGFNALSQSEQNIISFLMEKGRAEVFFDADPFYLDDPDHEAGMFLRRMRRLWNGKGFTTIKDHFKTPKSIEILNVPGNVAQARVAGQLLSENGGGTDTALVLANEQLLLPVLNSLPVDSGPVNVTMGFPLRSSDVFQLYLLLLDLQKARMDQDGKDKGGFYFRPFLEVLYHPVIREYLGTQADHIRDTIHQQRKVFIPDTYLARITDGKFSELGFLFHPWKNFPSDALLAFAELNDKLRGFYLNSTRDKLALEYVYHLSGVVERLQHLLHLYPYVKEYHSFRTLLRNYISQLDISFFGEPLEGLQLMGMLETRALDFKKVILLSANEDVLPKSRWEHSFVLYELKKFYGLPTYKERDAVYAHHFFRLLQRADQIWIVYNSDAEMLSGGEKSRFVLQLKEELPRYNSAVSIHEKVVVLPMDRHSILPVSVAKTPEIIQRILQHLQEGISPSALNKFVNCPLDFYYRYVLSIREDEELDDVSDHAVVGNVVHGVLERQYGPLVGHRLEVKDVDRFKSEHKEMAREVLRDLVGSSIDEGAYFLLHQVACTFLENFYSRELETLSEHTVEIISVEEKLSFKLQLAGQDIVLSGKADRIDRCNGVVRIIDYKTGKFEVDEVKVKDASDILKKGKSLQLLAYAWMYSRMHPEIAASVSAGIFPLRSSGDLELLRYAGNTELPAEAFAVFEHSLEEIIRSMLDLSAPFVHNPSSRYCGMCE